MAGTKISAATSGTTAVGTDRIPIYRVGQGASDKFYITPAMLYASPALTGTPTAPTAAATTNTTQVATTAFVQQEAFKVASGGTATGANTNIYTTTNTLTNQWSALGTTVQVSGGMLLNNSTDAAAGAQQISPIIISRGRGWKTNATAASQTVDMFQYMLPVQGAANPTGDYVFATSVNGAAATTIFTVNTTGKLNFPNSSPTNASSGDFWFNGNNPFFSSSGGTFRFVGNATGSSMALNQIAIAQSAGTVASSANLTFVTNRLLGTTLYLTLSAGTATAGTCPFVMTTGTVLTTAIAGGVEYNNTFHMTNSDATRRHVVLAPNTTKVTAGAPYTNDGYVVMNIGGTDFKFMTTA